MAKSTRENNVKVSHYFSSLSTGDSEPDSVLVKFKTQKTPEKHVLSDVSESPSNGLLSPDMIPPTPPVPKRIKLDESEGNSSHTLTKLQPKSLAQANALEFMLPAKNEAESDASKLHPVKSGTAACKIGTENILVEQKHPKRDFYHLGRHKVIKFLVTENDQEKRMVVEPENDLITIPRQCSLRDLWLETVIKEGDIVHIQAEWHGLFDENGDDLELAIIDRNNGLIVVQPDVLISGTSVVASLFCRRKAVLAERFRGVEGTSRQMLSGTLVHRLLQMALQDKSCDSKAMNEFVQRLLSDSSTLHDLYGSRLLKEDLHSDVVSFIPMIKYFIGKYVEGKNVMLPQNEVAANRKPSKPPPSWNGRIQAIADIEENIWSPWLGIKGKVDVTVKVKDCAREDLTMPLELKTGRSSFSAEHQGQVTLYTMMMNQTKPSSQKSESNPGGLLLYLKDGSIQKIPAKHNEKQQLIQLRNELVSYLTTPTVQAADGKRIEGPLPPRIDRLQMCQQCPFLTECTIYQEAQDAQEAAEPEVSGVVPDCLSHLSLSHRQYFLEWSLMLRLEWEENTLRKRSLSDIWCVDPRARELNGTCLSFLQIQYSTASQFHTSELDEYSITLVPASPRNFPLHLQFQRGDSVVLSTESEVAIATACLTEITASSVTVATDRNLTGRFENQAIHLDKLEYQGGQSMLYSNLSRLMADSKQAAKLRELVIDKRPPIFKPGLPQKVAELGKKVLKPLNKLQRKAVLKALTSEDYCLVHGLPGTGKTSLIVALIRLAVLMGYSVLLTSYTHTAVDNVLLKLVEHDEVQFIRIGRQHRIHPSILPYSAEVKSQHCSTVDDLERMYSVPVVAATCLSANHPVMLRRHFDFCIVDEAAQAMQLAVLGPLAAASKFVLVGDPQQLPPVVQSKIAKSLGMDESLFVRLSSATPDAIVPLQLQYRMCAPVNELANRLTYSGQLRCGDEKVETATLQTLSMTSVSRRFGDQPWLLSVIKPDLLQAVVFLDTYLLSSSFRCSMTDKATKAPLNRCEAAIALLLVEALQIGGVESEHIGIIAPYQSQVKFLKDLAMAYPNVEINSVDQYQGRDKEAIIYTCTRSESVELNQDGCHQTNTILHDIRRLTVAVTRAKHKLVIIGDSSTLKAYPPFAKLLGALESHQRYKLCDGSDGFYTQNIMTTSPAFK